MLYTNIKLIGKDDYLAEKFQAGYEFLRREDLADLPVGAIEVAEGVVANIQEYTTMGQDETKFEAHDANYDIQYMVKGKEHIGIVAREGLTAYTEYDAEKDIIFFDDPAESGHVVLQEGELIVLPVEDAHKTRCYVDSPEPVKKIVIKIKI